WYSLIFELDHGNPGLLIAPYRVAYVQKTAVAGVAISDNRLFHRVANRSRAVEHLRVVGNAGIRKTKVRCHHGKATHVNRFRQGSVDKLRRDQVKDAWGRNERFVLQLEPEVWVSHFHLSSCSVDGGRCRVRRQAKQNFKASFAETMSKTPG